MFALGAMTAGITACGDEEGTNNGGGTDDGPDVAEVIDATNFKIKANADGTITFVGDVAANSKIKTFQLTDASGNVVYDFLESNEQVKEKNKVYDENGKATKEKKFNLTGIESSKIAVDLYTLTIKTRKAKAEATLGVVLNYKIGASNSPTGSYLSIVDNEAFEQGDAETTKKAEVIAVSSADGNSVEGLKRASEARSNLVKANAGKVALFQDGVAASKITAGGVIITESGCICKVNSIDAEASGDATVKAVTIKTVEGLTVDVSGYAFSK